MNMCFCHTKYHALFGLVVGALKSCIHTSIFQFIEMNDEGINVDSVRIFIKIVLQTIILQLSFLYAIGVIVS